MYHVFPTKEPLLSLCRAQHAVICTADGVRELEAELQ